MSNKLQITLTLDDDTARDLVDLLGLGASNRYAPTLQRRGHELADYVGARVGAALLARGRARRKAQALELQQLVDQQAAG